MTTRSDLHRLVDELPEPALPAAEQRLAELRDPVLAAFLTAPDDDEPTTPEELAAIEEAEAELARGETVPWADVKRKLDALGA
jgi:hypothetical protein